MGSPPTRCRSSCRARCWSPCSRSSPICCSGGLRIGCVRRGWRAQREVGEVVGDVLRLSRAEAQPELGAPPKEILDGARPFVFDEPAQFGFAEPMAEIAAVPLRENGPGLAAIAARQPLDGGIVERWMITAQLLG